jgi:hypothetical protein
MRSNAWRFEPSMPFHHWRNDSIMCLFGDSRHREISSDSASREVPERRPGHEPASLVSPSDAYGKMTRNPFPSLPWWPKMEESHVLPIIILGIFLGAVLIYLAF